MGYGGRACKAEAEVTIFASGEVAAGASQGLVWP